MSIAGGIIEAGGRIVAAIVGCAALAACGTDVTGGGDRTFAGDPAQVITTASGALRVAVRFAPQPPVVGDDAAELVVTDAAGAPADGLTMEVFPWMPAHGHGVSVPPAVNEAGSGVFVAAPLYLSMPGHWELRLTIGGALDDAATATFEVR